MIKDNQSGLNRLHVVLDALVTVVSYLLAWYIVIGSGWARQLGKQTLEMEFYLGALIVIVPGYLLLYSFFNLYTPKRVLGRRNEFGKILKANTIGLLIFGLVRTPYFWSDPVLWKKRAASVQLFPASGRLFLWDQCSDDHCGAQCDPYGAPVHADQGL